MPGKKCPSCGVENNEQANFCRKCGTKLGEMAAPFRPGGQALGKRETVLDPNLAGGQLPQQQPPAGGSAAPPRPGGKGRTVVDSAQPQAGPGRKLVGFLVTYDLDPGHFGTFFPLYQGRTRVGAYVDQGEIQVDRTKDPAVSDVHCLMLWRNGKLSVADQMSSNGTWVDTATASREQYPDLYEGGPGATKPASFDGEEVPMICVEDVKIELGDGSVLKVGKTVFKVKLIGTGRSGTE